MEVIIEIFKFIIYCAIIILVSKYILVKILRKLAQLLSLKPKIVGNIAGIATSIPELLTTVFAASTGLINASAYNIISSNVINVIQYGLAITLNKNKKELKDKKIKIDLWLVALTIVIPLIVLILGIPISLNIVPIYIILALVFYKISNNSHKVFGKKDKDKNQEETKIQVKNKIQVFMQVIYLCITGVILYIVGDRLGVVLEIFSEVYKVPEIVIGILLGFVTSIPELITFFESQKHHSSNKEGVEEATSNLLSSNIMNVFVIQSFAVIVFLILN